MKASGRTTIAILVILLLTLPLLAACSSGDNEEPSPPTQPTAQPTATSKPTEPPPEDVTFTIGNLTDMTGVSASAQAVINASLDDLIRYFNTENLIPGMKLEVVAYDGQFNPAKDIPGYEWLREKGSDLIITAVTSTPVTLQPRVNKDEILLFSLSGNLETLVPPGYVFTPTSLPEHEGLTLLKWIAENDWDYQTKGPAKIGGAAWAEPNAQSFMGMAEAYAKTYPDQFEWAGSYLAPVGTFTWGPEAKALEDCDYVFTPNPMTTFVKEYRTAGYTGKFIGNGPHVALLKLVDDANLWDEIDGMLFVTPSRWWGEDGELVDLREKLLYENHPDTAETIKRMGGAYNALDNFYMVLDIIRVASENVGPTNVDSQALYEAAQTYSITTDGVERYSFGETKRYACNYYGIYEASGDLQDLYRTDPAWHYHVTEP